MGVTNRKEVEINMLKQSTINQRLQESKDVSVLVFPDKKGVLNKHHPRSGQERTQPGNGTKKTKLSIYKKYTKHILHCVIQLNEPCTRQTFFALNI